MEEVFWYSVRDENIGTVLDSVAAVIVGIVRDAFETVENLPPSSDGWQTARQKIENGDGVGRSRVVEVQPNIPLNSARSAIDCLKATGKYDI